MIEAICSVPRARRRNPSQSRNTTGRNRVGFTMVAALGLSCVVGCYSNAQYQEMVAAASIDIGYEQDVLYECARQVTGEIGPIEHSQATLRVVITEWSIESTDDAAERVRTATRIIFDPDFGPGVTVARSRESWRGDIAVMDPDGPLVPDPSSPGDGWVPAPRTEADESIEFEVASDVQSCWLDLREADWSPE